MFSLYYRIAYNPRETPPFVCSATPSRVEMAVPFNQDRLPPCAAITPFLSGWLTPETA